MYQQREEPEEDTFAPIGPWQPSLEEGTSRLLSLGTDTPGHYVVIDEIIDGRVGLVVSAWPKTDATGRLAFEEDGVPVAKAFEADSLESILNLHRHDAGQTERSLRVGDVFYVQDFDASDPGRWRGVLDVTQAARPATKAAFLRAVAQQPPEPPIPISEPGLQRAIEESADLDTLIEEPRSPKGSSASPVI